MTHVRRAAATLLFLVSACGIVRDAPPPLDPEATFAAHRVHGGFLIDRLPDGGTGVIEARRWPSFSEPTFTVCRDDATARRGVWALGPGAALARATPDASAPIVVEVRPSWIDQAIVLDIVAPGGDVLRVGPLKRVAGAGISTLSRVALTNLDLRGTFRAPVVDARGATRGWLQATVSPSDGTRLYEAVLGAAPALAGPAVAVALEAELDWIMDGTIDVYGGTGNDRTILPDGGR